MPFVIHDGAGFIVVFYQLLQLIVQGFSRPSGLMLAPVRARPEAIKLSPRKGNFLGAEIILGGRRLSTAQAAKPPPASPGRHHRPPNWAPKLASRPAELERVGADDPLAALVQIVIEPHILAMVLDIELLLGLGQAAREGFMPSLLSSSRSKNSDELPDTSGQTIHYNRVRIIALLPPP